MFIQFVINGLITGILYSLYAIGFALVYNTTKIFHISAAALYVFAAFMFHWSASQLNLPLFVSIVFSIALTMVLSWLMELAVYRPLLNRKASGNTMMIASIGMMTVVINIVSILFGSETKLVAISSNQVFAIHNILITTPQLTQAAVGGLALLMLLIFLYRSPYGLRFRALSSDITLFETLGYNAVHTRNIVFIISGAAIAITSCLMALDFGLDTQMGMDMLINALVAMIIGGFGNFGMCVAGGISLGLLQSVTVYCFSLNWQNAVTFVLLLIILFLRPQGIAGYKQRSV